MKKKVISIDREKPLYEAVYLFINHHIGTLPVVQERKLVGIVSLHDVLNLTMPEFFHIVRDVKSIRTFGACEDQQPHIEALEQRVYSFMKKPFYVNEDTGLLRAFAFFHEHNVYDIPVVDKAGNLVGIASYVDVGVALMKNWKLSD